MKPCDRPKRRPALTLLAALLGLACVTAPGSTPPSGDAPEARRASLLSRIRQLTFSGRRSGEGYFSQDGSKMVFQSEREEGNPFYQIYLMDLETGELERVSPGVGKTTCAWIHPGGGRVLFASTHLDPEATAKQQRELEMRASGTQRRYSWDYDEHYDLFVSDLDGAPPRALAPALGYDAEGSWSPDGRMVVFASNRHAYEELYASSFSEEDRLRLEEDPSTFMDIYLMDSRGRELRRLTRSAGYDGGPFFSPDGQRIVWRRFSEDGRQAEVLSMKIDGSDEKQLTRLGAMSWAPFYHPSGDYIVFATSLQGHQNFELYMVDAEGLQEPVRVTDSEGFDSLPVFAPDGATLSWVSRRGSGEGAQIFLADWNDSLARRQLGLPPRRGTEVAPLLPLPVETRPEIRIPDLRAHVDALASEVTAGRRTGTAGERIATSYVARFFRRLGLEPAGDNGTFFQEFGFTAGVSLGEDNQLNLEDGGEPLEVDRDWRPLAFSKVGDLGEAPVVFAGYGIVSREGEEIEAVDSYAGLDVTDKWVLVFRFVPAELPKEARRHLRQYASLRHKTMVARERGARGVILVSGPNSKAREELTRLAFDTTLAATSIGAISITDATADRLLRSSGRSLGELQARFDRDVAAEGFELEGVSLRARIDLQQQRRKGRNVIARLRVAEEPTPSIVAIGAHVDHLGRGKSDASLARDPETDAIHYGADDNASGVAAVIEVAQLLTDRKAAGRLPATRDILFAAWSGEELGLLGSSHYIDSLSDPQDPHGSLAGKVAAYLNLDMVGRLDGELSLFGVGSSSSWLREVERRNTPLGLPVSTTNDSYLPTDATSFYLRGIPILSAFTGTHEDYHRPTDVSERLNYQGLRDVAQLMASISQSLAVRSEPMDYVAMDRPSSSRERSSLRVYLGTIPDYTQSEQQGVLLSGVVKGGPAEGGGLLAGDLIVELDGRTIENVYDYTYALGDLEIDEPVEIVVLRGGERISLTVVPGSRE
jgi:Tol biopolymer transport system component